jgi:hypothetical protein
MAELFSQVTIGFCSQYPAHFSFLASPMMSGRSEFKCMRYMPEVFLSVIESAAQLIVLFSDEQLCGPSDFQALLHLLHISYSNHNITEQLFVKRP